MPDPSPARPHDNFDFLRLFAALMVIYGHGWILSTNEGPGFWGVPFARAGLDVFFSISGYMVTGSWLRAPRLGAFLLKRALRIMPGLVACVLFTAFVLGARLSSLPLRAYLADPGTLAYLWNAAFYPVLRLPGVFAGLWNGGAVNGSLWSLFPEVLCYLTVPAFALLPARARLWALGLGAVAAGVPGMWLIYGENTPSVIAYGTDVRHVLAQVPFFFIGGLFRLLEGRVPNLYRADLAILGYTLNWMVSSWYGWWNVPVEWVTLPYMVLCFGRGSIPVLRRAGRFGDLSFGMYLYAFPVQQVILGARPDFGHPIIACMVLTAPLALLSWHLVEAPALRWKPGAQRFRAQAGPVAPDGQVASQAGANRASAAE